MLRTSCDSGVQGSTHGALWMLGHRPQHAARPRTHHPIEAGRQRRNRGSKAVPTDAGISCSAQTDRDEGPTSTGQADPTPLCLADPDSETGDLRKAPQDAQRASCLARVRGAQRHPALYQSPVPQLRNTWCRRPRYGSQSAGKHHSSASKPPAQAPRKPGNGETSSVSISTRARCAHRNDGPTQARWPVMPDASPNQTSAGFWPSRSP